MAAEFFVGFARVLHEFCAAWVLIDSAPELMGWNADMTCVEVPNVVVLHRMGVKDDLDCADRPAHWEFWMGLDCMAWQDDSRMGQGKWTFEYIIRVMQIAGGWTGIRKYMDFQRGTNGTWLQLLRSCTLSPDLLSLISDGDWAWETGRCLCKSTPRCMCGCLDVRRRGYCNLY